eukprot:gene19372-biopygen14559
MLCSGSVPRSAPPQHWLSPGSAADLGQHGTHGHFFDFFGRQNPRDAAAMVTSCCRLTPGSRPGTTSPLARAPAPGQGPSKNRVPGRSGH